MEFCIWFSYKLDTWSRYLKTGFTLGNCLLGVVKFSKNNNLDKNRYGDYVIGFDSGLQFFYCQTVAWVKMLLVLVLIWGHLCMLITKKKDILVLGEGLTQGLDNTTIIPEVKYPINFTESKKKICVKFAL